MKDRIYVCHTYYHAYIVALKELNLEKEKRGNATLVLSTMSNDFGNLKERAERCGLFEEVCMFDASGISVHSKQTQTVLSFGYETLESHADYDTGANDSNRRSG